MRVTPCERGRWAKQRQVGEDRLKAKHVQMDRGAEERAPVGLVGAPVQRPAPQGGPASLMLLVAGLFAGSTLVSLTVLWFAVRGIRWLLGG
jgi:hypothetical protein